MQIARLNGRKFPPKKLINEYPTIDLKFMQDFLSSGHLCSLWRKSPFDFAMLPFTG